MTDLTLRPLSLGEILDRAFSLYRSRFPLFVGISAIPQVFILAVALLNPLFNSAQPLKPGTFTINVTALVIAFVSLLVFGFVYLFAQGATTLAVAELYLGRSTSIAESLKRVGGEIWLLLGVAILSGLAVMAGAIFLIIPGLYIACRVLVAVPAALIERRGPAESLSRSFTLTKGFAGRAFAILVLSVILQYAATALFQLPFSIPLAGALNDPSALRFWTAITQVAGSIANALVGPIPLIANSIFYYDLRVRKEAFDIQFMMNPESQRPPDASGMSSILS